MGVATLGPHRFRLDPVSVSWDYQITAKDIPTIGGKVVQVLGSHLGDMTVRGSFGKGGWREQARFLDAMKAIGTQQVNAQRISNNVNAQPFRFRYPPKRWDFAVYLTGFKQPGQFGSIQLDSTTTAPEWELTLFIVEGAQGLKQVAKDLFISRLSEGIGWKQTAYNGPMSMSEVEGVLQGKTVVEYISEQQGIAPSPSTGGGGSTGM